MFLGFYITNMTAIWLKIASKFKMAAEIEVLNKSGFAV